MKGVFKFLFNRWTVTVLGLAALSLLIWFVGPLVAIAEYHPLESETIRLILIASVIGIYIGKLIWGAIKARNLNARLMEGLMRHPSTPAQPGDSAGTEEIALLRKRFEEAVDVLKQSSLSRPVRNPILALLTRRQYVYELPW